ncbi:hypothetical protein BN8_02568 [Fibrisoma limi BUZ 3]|uniref:Uncharacterized protein n=1 Tax=Fibrisoma limi BUZ 3 TaxID=1185876 RepID=I2GHU6_9BACT|nr:hypothetical protein [Fibrisoma limi]CCH53471.1 hypothetical protein BN8_02568 [Fibrisoma limi BUZ 3]
MQITDQFTFNADLVSIPPDYAPSVPKRAGLPSVGIRPFASGRSGWFIGAHRNHQY